MLGKEENVDVVIFGHSHTPYIDDRHKPYLFNPGSIALPRNNEFQKSYGIIEIENKHLKFKIKYVNAENE
ncbi:hypothetical protein FACS1894166_08770 [Bacilli bacterium]|nr:hypothetical protein FACS1894166_08770 [Bacilli bacterium]